jgi:hypothetical protein
LNMGLIMSTAFTIYLFIYYKWQTRSGNYSNKEKKKKEMCNKRRAENHQSKSTFCFFV